MSREVCPESCHDSSVSLVVWRRRGSQCAEDCVFWMLTCRSIAYLPYFYGFNENFRNPAGSRLEVYPRGR